MTTNILSLYKRILTLHKKKLSGELKSVGDNYVKEEFKLIKNAKKEVFVKQYESIVF